MAKEKQESTQISWRLDGSRLTATIPVINENVTFDVADLHESWLLFIKAYGIQQHASSFLAKYSFSAPKELKAELADAIAKGDTETEALAREAIKEAKKNWLNENATELRTALFNQMKLYKAEMPEKKEAVRESKAAVEARVKAEMIEKMRSTFKAQGFDDATIETLLKGVIG